MQVQRAAADMPVLQVIRYSFKNQGNKMPISSSDCGGIKVEDSHKGLWKFKETHQSTSG